MAEHLFAPAPATQLAASSLVRNRRFRTLASLFLFAGATPLLLLNLLSLLAPKTHDAVLSLDLRRPFAELDPVGLTIAIFIALIVGSALGLALALRPEREVDEDNREPTVRARRARRR